MTYTFKLISFVQKQFYKITSQDVFSLDKICKKEKCKIKIQQIHDKTELDGIFWMETNNNKMEGKPQKRELTI